MSNYEEISNKYKILWIENYIITNEIYTQVSGYILNNKNELLIVKSNNEWTIPGGHPEIGENPIDTLIREIMEEASITIEDIKYIGAVHVLEKDKDYYQLRYIGKVKEILGFDSSFETTERKFIPLSNLHKYIKWANGMTFTDQINTVKHHLI